MRRALVFAQVAAAAVLALSVAAGPATAQRGMGRGQRVSTSVPCVQLTAEQQERIAAIRREGQQQIAQIRQDPNLTAAQKEQRIAEAQRRTHQRVLEVLTVEQRRAFYECGDRPDGDARGFPRGMEQGRAGGVSGTVPGVTDLSAEQRERIAAIRREAREQIQAVQRDRDLTREERERRIAAIQERSHARVLAVLTPAQRQAFLDRWGERGAVAGSREERGNRGQGRPNR